MHQLLILRHGEAGTPQGGGDVDRPLTPRGRRDADRIAAWLQVQGLQPDVSISSSAARARETARRVGTALGTRPDALAEHQRLYLAPPETIISVLHDLPEAAERVLLVGHNPGLASFLYLLAGQPANLATCTLAVLDVDGPWAALGPGMARLVHLIRPGDLDASPI